MKFARALAASMLCAVAACGAAAQTYPNRPVTLVVAFAPGGADDATARILQDPMQKALGQPIVVENDSGAGGTRSPPARRSSIFWRGKSTWVRSRPSSPRH